MDPVTGYSTFHPCQVFLVETGTTILSAAGGVVVVQEFPIAYGNMVEVDHGIEVWVSGGTEESPSGSWTLKKVWLRHSHQRLPDASAASLMGGG